MRRFWGGLLVSTWVACAAPPPGSPQGGGTASPAASTVPTFDPALLEANGLPAGSVRFVPQVGLKDQAEVTSTAISPDGRLALAAGDDGSIEVWHLPSRMLLRTVRRLPKARHGNRPVFMPDSRRMLFAKGGTVAVLDLDATDPPVVLPGGGRRPIEHLSLSADGKHAATSDGSEAWILWDVAGRRVVRTVRGEGRVEALALAADGAHVAVARGKVGEHRVLWRGVADGASARELGRAEKDVRALAVGPKGKRVAWGSPDAGTVVVEVASGRELARDEPRWPARALAFRPDGALAVANVNGFGIYAVAGGKLEREAAAGHRVAGSLAFSADGAWIASAGGRGPLRIWKAKGEARPKAIRLEAPWGRATSSLAVTGDDRVVVGTRNGLMVWDLATLRLEGVVGGRKFNPRALAITADGSSALVSGHAASFVNLDGSRGGRSLRAGTMGVRGVALSPDGTLAATAGVMDDEPLRLFDAATGKPLRSMDAGDERSFDAVAFSRDGKTLVATRSSRVGFWDVVSGAKRASAQVRGTARHLVVSPAHDDVAVADRKKVWVIGLDGAMRRTLTLPTEVASLAFDPNGKALAIGGVLGSVRLAALPQGDLIRSLGGHRTPVVAVAFSRDGTRVISGSEEGELRVHRRDGSESIALLAAGSAWLAYADDGYFDASRDGGALVAITQGRKVFRPDQLALRFNRPDLLMERLGLGDPAHRRYLQRRFVRRLQKAAPTARRFGAGLGAPTASIRSHAIDGAHAALSVALDDDEGLQAYNVFVNGVAVHGLAGKPVDGKHAEPAVRVPLTPGANRIEVSAVNARGIESLRAEVAIEHRAAKGPKPRLRYIGFGVSKYRKKALDLDFAHRDAIALGDALAKMGRSYRVERRVFTDAQVTADRVRAARKLVRDLHPEDMLVVFVAGHGIHDRDPDSTYYFVTHETEPKRLRETAANFEAIEALLLEAPARRKLLLIDTCQSGEDAEGGGALPARKGKRRGLRMRNVRGLELGLPARPKASRRANWFDRNRFIETDLRRRSGAVVLSSSRGDESSFEDEKARHGLFTKAVLDALRGRRADKNRDRRLSTEELLAFVARQVAADSGGAQHPTIDRDNPLAGIALPLAR